MDEFLAEAGLSKHGGSMRALGAASVQDLHDVEDSDLEQMGMKPLEAKRFRRKLSERAGGGGAAAPPTVANPVASSFEMEKPAASAPMMATPAPANSGQIQIMTSRQAAAAGQPQMAPMRGASQPMLQQPMLQQQPPQMQMQPQQPPQQVVMQQPQQVGTTDYRLLSVFDGLFIREQVQMLEVFTGFEQCNRYDIFGSAGGVQRQILHAAEESDCCARQCCKGQRPFKLNIFNNPSVPLITVDRPYQCCLQELTVYAGSGSVHGGTMLGKVQQTCCEKCCSQFTGDHNRLQQLVSATTTT